MVISLSLPDEEPDIVSLALPESEEIEDNISLSLPEDSTNKEPVSVSGQKYFVYDGDTLINQKTGESVRLPGIDAGEVSRVGKHGELHLGSAIGPIHTEALYRLIDEGGFNKKVPYTGGVYSDTDKYGRELHDLVNPAGESLVDLIHRERIMDNYSFATRRQQALRYLGEFSDSLRKNSEHLSLGDKVREMVENAVDPSSEVLRPVLGTSEQVWHGSPGQVNMIEAELNRLNSKLRRAKTEEEKEALKEQISNTRMQLTYAVNIPQQALTTGLNLYSSNKYRPGYWAESFNAAEKSLYMMENTLAGFNYWLGDITDNEAMEEWGKAWAESSEEDLQNAGYTTGFWDIRNPLDAMRFMSSVIIHYGPQMGSFLAAGAAGFAVGGPLGAAIGGTGAGFIMAVSSFYQNMPDDEKDPMTAMGYAIPIALLDRFGATKVMPIMNMWTKTGRDTLSKALIEQGIAKPIIKKGVTVKSAEKVAQEMVGKGIRDVLKDSATLMQNHAVKQMLAKKTFKDVMKQSAKAAGIEGTTEALQQVIEEMGLDFSTSLNVDYEQLLYNMTEAFATGGVLGGTFTLPSTLKAFDSHNRAHWEFMPEDPNRRTKESRWTQEHMERNAAEAAGPDAINITPTKLSLLEIASRIRGKYARPEVNLREMENRGSEKDSSWRDFMYAMRNPSRFLQAMRGFSTKHFEKRNGDSNYFMQIFGSLFGATNNLYSGESFASEYRTLESVWAKDLFNRDNLSSAIGLKEEELFPLLRLTDQQLRGEAALPDGTFLSYNPKIIEGVIKAKNNLKDLATNMKIDIQNRSDTMFKEMKNFTGANKAGEKALLNKLIDLNISAWDTGVRNNNYFFTPSSFNASTIDAAFRDALLKVVKPTKGKLKSKKSQQAISESRADEIIDEIMTDNLSLENRALLDSAGVFSNPEFSKYLNQSVYDNTLALINTIAKETVFQSRFGKNGEIPAALLEQAESAGEIDTETKHRMANMAMDWIRMNRGNYRPIKNKTIKKIQDHALFLGTISFMDTNFFANMVEIVNSTMGLGPKQFFRQIKDFGSMFGKSVYNDLTKRAAYRVGATRDRTKRDIAKDDIRFRRMIEAGLLAPKGAISLYEGVNTMSPAYQKFLNHFWAINQVENQTDALRGGRAASAWEEIAKLIVVVKNKPEGYHTGASRWATDRLNYYGLNPDRMVELFNKVTKTPDEKSILEGNTDNLSQREREELMGYYRTGIARFTDEFVVRPEPGSAPRIIEDPHFFMFTHFKRFITTFSANVIPRLWKGYITSGKPGMTYSVFTTIIGAYAMAFLSMMIKDMIVYGGTPPWLDDEEDPSWLRTTEFRAADYTGWMGTPGMAVKFIGDYSRASAYKNPVENLFESIVGESPVLGALYGDFINTNRTLTESAVRRTPFIGDINVVREAAIEQLNNIGK